MTKLILQTVEMKLNCQEAFSIRAHDGYKTLLWDVMKNDPTSFMRADQVEAAWRLLKPALEAWAVFQKLTGLLESRNRRTS